MPSPEYALMFSLDPWSFPKTRRPDPEQLDFDLDQSLNALLQLHVQVPPQAYTAPILGTTRTGHGVAIDTDGHILTIGYLVTEAEQVWCRKRDGTVVQADVLAYDQPSGFGLLKSFSRLDCGFIPLGKSSQLAAGDPVYMLGHGGIHQCLKTAVTAIKPFAACSRLPVSAFRILQAFIAVYGLWVRPGLWFLCRLRVAPNFCR
ncbi:MAG: serine protease [Betaproteobacteria bacterium]|nr:serine protease [Betaproteobacteria bacterium]